MFCQKIFTTMDLTKESHLKSRNLPQFRVPATIPVTLINSDLSISELIRLQSFERVSHVKALHVASFWHTFWHSSADSMLLIVTILVAAFFVLFQKHCGIGAKRYMSNYDQAVLIRSKAIYLSVRFNLNRNWTERQMQCNP